MAAQSAAIGASSVVQDRVSRNGGRLKKTTIVALARKLLVALWKYVTAGVVRAPERRSEEIEAIYRDSISLGGSGWTNQTSPWPEKPLSRMVSSS